VKDVCSHSEHRTKI